MEAKKYPVADISQYRILFFNIGLVISLSLIFTAFEWKFYDKIGVIDNGVGVNDNFEELLDVPPTEQPPPPPPQFINVNLIEIKDTEIIEDELNISFDIEMTEEMVVEQLPEIVDVSDVDEEVADEIFLIVEEQPHPIGGMAAFYSYINATIKYPSQARRMGIEGRVFVQFIIEKDGSISQVEVIRGISESCDAEAIKVVSSAPAWKPGKQRGVPVRVKMALPISFKLR